MKKYLLPLSIASLLLACGLLLSNGPVNGAQAQQQHLDDGKLLEKGNDFNPPVEITLVRSQVGRIEPGRKFSADEDWFKGLTVSVRNDTGEPLTHISLYILFPRPKWQENELSFIAPLDYGESPIPFPDGRIPINTAMPIAPGESVELRLSDGDYHSLRTHLRESRYPPSINRIKLNVRMLGFSDGTIWMGGKRYEPDKNEPGKLIPLGKKNFQPRQFSEVHSH